MKKKWFCTEIEVARKPESSMEMYYSVIWYFQKPKLNLVRAIPCNLYFYFPKLHLQMKHSKIIRLFEANIFENLYLFDWFISFCFFFFFLFWLRLALCHKLSDCIIYEALQSVGIHKMSILSNGNIDWHVIYTISFEPFSDQIYWIWNICFDTTTNFLLRYGEPV